ncbi:MBL fold metallo-hydrolase [Actinoplanes sp. OR16]|uniref:MBL fold metallo-hydrolase n=1 Tax=Actinoplanes sp. OR16 TaxID=946334 RepID=UPI000F6F3506|nr:MBL fold metallo-hydrolase [Actinoplanes sp. OR16]BBH68224.1 MBL fold metallo-hydrolase [Actinoplanes sp. OR16]
MRIRFGRPDISRYAGRLDLPAATGKLGVTFLGVSGLVFADDEHAVMTDGYFSRPSLPRVLLGRVAPDPARIGAALERLALGDRLRAVAAVHSHFDHVLDAPSVALRTGAVLVGGESTANVGRGGDLPEDRIRVVRSGETVEYGSFTMTFVASAHCPPDRYPGVITAPVRPPARATAYRCGEAWSILVGHESGRTALVQGTAGFVPGALGGHRADTVYLGVGGLGVLPETYIRDYWAHTVAAVGARRVVLTHWDDLFRTLGKPLRALPYFGDDLDVTIRVLTDLARRDGVTVHLPTLWRRSS